MRRLRRTLRRVSRVWVLAVLVILGTAGGALSRWMSEDRRIFLPGQTSHAHYQIEIACHTCHTPFEGVKQDACLRCHAEQLRAANDTHPVSKFGAPTGEHTGKALDATRCITCHKEHAPRITRAVAVTQPADFCVQCHSDIGKERPSHRTFAFVTCATAGCHNYHDNTALRADALAAGRGAPAVLPRPVVSVTGRDRSRPVKNRPSPSRVIPEWESSAHARADIRCPKCHEVRDTGSSAPRWNERPGHAACAKCHEHEVQGFLGGRHGMRLLQGLSPMTPAMARLPMKPEAHARGLTCAACHDAHAFDTRRAAVEGCLSCHDDVHSRAYPNSPHHRTWRSEMAGQAAPGSGVSCATCHLPRGVHGPDGRKRVIVQHNQNDNLRPIAKMLRTVCLHCHGLAFSIDALSDRELARKNYAGRPSRHVESIDMVEANLRGKAKRP
jgi:predicted CXXCH cytochrome family protein